ncbi:hypothetical protein Poly24_47290 [Rosistilla carotiformis]|uniref:Uncharacterized protein n=1 Tax=Rosistilla carotiformis TaxID=2528017 RepID=A0A518JZM0_9BACT|nr:hypothetical protein Poly24_47290 [Rosistilla carotiformis]
MKFNSFWNLAASSALLLFPCHWAAAQQSNTDTPKLSASKVSGRNDTFLRVNRFRRSRFYGSSSNV